MFPVVIGETGSQFILQGDLDFYGDFALYLNAESYENDGLHNVVRDLFWYAAPALALAASCLGCVPFADIEAVNLLKVAPLTLPTDWGSRRACMCQSKDSASSAAGGAGIQTQVCFHQHH